MSIKCSFFRKSHSPDQYVLLFYFILLNEEIIPNNFEDDNKEGILKFTD